MLRYHLKSWPNTGPGRNRKVLPQRHRNAPSSHCQVNANTEWFIERREGSLFLRAMQSHLLSALPGCGYLIGSFLLLPLLHHLASSSSSRRKQGCSYQTISSNYSSISASSLGLKPDFEGHSVFVSTVKVIRRILQMVKFPATIQLYSLARSNRTHDHFLH
jgi:hypothetical protein